MINLSLMVVICFLVDLNDKSLDVVDNYFMLPYIS